MSHLILVCYLVIANPPSDSASHGSKPQPKSEARTQTVQEVEQEFQRAIQLESRGNMAERDQHLWKVIDLQADHAKAHGLLGLVKDEGEWRTPEEIAERVGQNSALTSTLRRYQDRRDAVAETAESHWQLADWCEQNGLAEEAKVHLLAVLRLNSSRVEAAKRLGYRKTNGRWASPDQLVAERMALETQRKADAQWHKNLTKWKTRRVQPRQRKEAEAALAKIDDPFAIPSIWRVFGKGKPTDQAVAVRLLSQIDSQSASRILATTALLGTTPEVRRAAVESLALRDPREFADLLITSIRDPIEYEVKQVDGPGSPGELYIKGDKENNRQFYAAPPPMATIRPGEAVSFDEYGLPVVNRVVGYTWLPLSAAIDTLLVGAPDLTGLPQLLSHQGGLGALGQKVGERAVQNQKQAAIDGQLNGMGGINYAQTLTAPIPVGQLALQAQRQAQFSKQRLEQDVARLDRYNQQIAPINERAILTLKTAIGEDLGSKRSGWLKWWSTQEVVSSSAPPRGDDVDAKQDAPEHEKIFAKARVASFGAGTPVWTLTGLRPIESIRAGDSLLTQDTTTGALGYSPVITIRRTTGEPVETLTISGETIVATALARLWQADRGWVRTHDLKPGDSVRNLRGLSSVEAVANEANQTVFHVRVAPGRGIFIGKHKLLAHDDRLTLPISLPFDRIKSVDAGSPIAQTKSK